MAKDNPTLKDLAQALGVSATTVHRALQGKEGVGEKMRERVRQAAAEMGYRSNYMASALKRGSPRLAVVFPEATLENRYFCRNLWLGARQYLEAVAEFGAEIVELTFPFRGVGSGEALRQLWEQQGERLDGVVTLAVDHPQTAYFIEKLAEKGVPVALVGADLYRDHRLCAALAEDEMAGSLAAELLTAFRPGETGRKLILTGNLLEEMNMQDQYRNIQGFEAYIRRHAPDTALFTAFATVEEDVGSRIRELLAEHPDVSAIYACSARHTVQMCRAVRDMGRAGGIPLVGSDTFPESLDLLREGTLTAIVDKKIARQSYLATQALFNYVVKGEYSAGSALRVRPAVVMRSNLGTPGAEPLLE